MSLRILFADDSVTAQNMGRKILTEAGYEVVAVNNGAAAVKKIAEQKPDIIILDVYMPGYSGLEVCEKVRGCMETLKTPVLLTVGKMEPYKPEETNRVRADGVIVKPFEASDLLATVKKFEERIGQGSTPTLIKPIAVDRFHDNADPVREMPVERADRAVIGSVPQTRVEVPDHMATSSAFSDLLGPDTASADPYNVNAPPTRLPRPASIQAPIPDYDIPVFWSGEELPGTDVISAPVPTPVPVTRETNPGPVPAVGERALHRLQPPAPAPPALVPVYEERKTSPAPLEIVPTAASPAREVEIVREPELQETAAETTRATAADAVEPGLIPTMQQSTFPVAEAMPEPPELAAMEDKVLGNFEEPLALVWPEVPVSEAVRSIPEEPVERKLAESDFEARVAAAVAAYTHSTRAIQEPPAAAAVQAPVATQPSPGAPQGAGLGQGELNTSSESTMPAATGNDAAMDQHTIAQAVHRVMERLKPELVEEIVRDLKSKK